jgi:hypothetical protein
VWNPVVFLTVSWGAKQQKFETIYSGEVNQGASVWIFHATDGLRWSQTDAPQFSYDMKKKLLENFTALARL